MLTDSLVPCAGSTMNVSVSTSFAIWLRAATAGRTGSFVMTAMSLSPRESAGSLTASTRAPSSAEPDRSSHIALGGRLSEQGRSGRVHGELGEVDVVEPVALGERPRELVLA